MTLSMLDQMLSPLACGHDVVLGRLADRKTWTCEACGRVTDLIAGSYKVMLDHDLETANQIDLQAKAGGEKVERAG